MGGQSGELLVSPRGLTHTEVVKLEKDMAQKANAAVKGHLGVVAKEKNGHPSGVTKSESNPSGR